MQQATQQKEQPVWVDCPNCKSPMRGFRCANCGRSAKKPVGMLTSIWHHVLRSSGDSFTPAGCSCRGCKPWNMRKRAEYVRLAESAEVR